MDRRGKERLIGAGVLVALAVVVVPELLSGPKPAAPVAESSPRFPAGAPDPVRNVTLDLATSKPEVATTAAPPTPTPVPPPVQPPEPAPTAPLDEANAVPPPVVPQARPPAGRPPAGRSQDSRSPDSRPIEPAVAPASSAGGFSVQLGSFANRGNADNLVHQLKAQGYPVYEASEGAGNSARYRVRVGPLSDRDAAERTIAKLKAQGHSSTLIAPR